MAAPTDRLVPPESGEHSLEDEPLLASESERAAVRRPAEHSTGTRWRLAALALILVLALGVVGALAAQHEPLDSLPLPTSEPICSAPGGIRGPGPPLTILTITNDELPKPYLECLRASRLEYAARYGLEYCEYTGEYAPTAYNFCWKKLVAIKGMLVGSLARPLIWYLDADALILNTTIDVRETLAPYGSTEAIFAADYSWCEKHHTRDMNIHPPIKCEDPAARPVSGGVIVFRNTRWVRTLLDTVYTKAGKRRGWGTKGEADNVEFTRYAQRNKDEFRRHAAVIPQTVMNSMRKTYARGDFVYHRAGGDWYQDRKKVKKFRRVEHKDKYAFLTPVCRAALANASAAEREATTAMLEATAQQIVKEINWT